MNESQNISSQADNQNQNFESAEAIKIKAAQAVRQIEELVQNGAMTKEQGLDLMNFVTKKAYEKYTNYGLATDEQESVSAVKKLEDTPEFFNRDGRIDVFDYLKSTNTDFDDDEISKISALVEKIEKSAVDRYLRQIEHEKMLNNENEAAKMRLRANAQNAVSDSGTNMVFTREQIGKMSGAEFAKYERAIMDQLKKGLIR